MKWDSELKKYMEKRSDDVVSEQLSQHIFSFGCLAKLLPSSGTSTMKQLLDEGTSGRNHVVVRPVEPCLCACSWQRCYKGHTTLCIIVKLSINM